MGAAVEAVVAETSLGKWKTVSSKDLDRISLKSGSSTLGHGSPKAESVDGRSKLKISRASTQIMSSTGDIILEDIVGT
jgi:hypothetical protein